jgi:hypothetical protein
MNDLSVAQRLAPATIPVLRERGQRQVFCGLTSIVWLHRKLQDAFSSSARAPARICCKARRV